MKPENADTLLLQEIYADDPWKMLVCCVLLNQTTRLQVERVLWPEQERMSLFGRYPTARDFATGSEVVQRGMLTPLGLQNRRVKTLRGLSSRWHEMEAIKAAAKRWPPHEFEVASLPGVGEYALDSYRFFVLGDLQRFESGDKELALWLAKRRVSWARALATES